MGPCNSASAFLVFYQFATKSIQNNQNLKFSADPPHDSPHGAAARLTNTTSRSRDYNWQ